MKRLGLIGGIGTLAGVDLVRRMVEECAKRGAHEDSDFPDFVYLNVPVQGTDCMGKMPESAFDSLKQSLGELDSLKCGVAIILCNTAHLEFDALARCFSGRLVNIVEEGCAKATSPVAVLCSSNSAQHGLYESKLRSLGKKVVPIDTEARRYLDNVISLCMKGDRFSEIPSRFALVVQRATSLGASQVLIGCTELSMIPYPVQFAPALDAGWAGVQKALSLCRE